MESTRAPLIRWAAGTRRRHQIVGAALRGLAPLLPRKVIPRQPVFILGSPRSGTTMLFNLVDRSPRMVSLGKGSHFLWDMFHTIEGADWASHAVRPDQITDRERKVLYWVIDRLVGGSRYMDITGWRTEGKFGQGTLLPVPLSIEGYSGSKWRFLVPPGWRDYTSGRSLAEVCAFQWVSANEAVLAAKAQVDPERWIEISYEELLGSPKETTARLFEGIGLPADDEVLRWASELDTHVSRTAVTAPRREKWRQEHPHEIDGILPIIEPMMRRLGYETR